MNAVWCGAVRCGVTAPKFQTNTVQPSVTVQWTSECERECECECVCLPSPPVTRVQARRAPWRRQWDYQQPARRPPPPPPPPPPPLPRGCTRAPQHAERGTEHCEHTVSAANCVHTNKTRRPGPCKGEQVTVYRGGGGGGGGRVLCRGHFHDERCEMSIRNGQLTIAFNVNVAVTNGRFTTLIVEMP